MHHAIDKPTNRVTQRIACTVLYFRVPRMRGKVRKRESAYFLIIVIADLENTRAVRLRGGISANVGYSNRIHRCSQRHNAVPHESTCCIMTA